MKPYRLLHRSDGYCVVWTFKGRHELSPLLPTPEALRTYLKTHDLSICRYVPCT